MSLNDVECCIMMLSEDLGVPMYDAEVEYVEFAHNFEMSYHRVVFIFRKGIKKLWIRKKLISCLRERDYPGYLTEQNVNDPYIALSWDNLEALCQDCHNKEHHRSKRKKRYSFDENGTRSLKTTT